MNVASCVCCACGPNLSPEHYPTVAEQFTNGMEIGQNTAPIEVGTPMVERCARLAETICGACGEQHCVRCTVAKDIREAGPRLTAERDAELRAAVFEGILNAVIAALCPQHADFASVLATKAYRRLATMGINTSSQPPSQSPSPMVKSES